MRRVRAPRAGLRPTALPAVAPMAVAPVAVALPSPAPLALALLAVALLSAACASHRTPDVQTRSHVVQPGENLWRISQRYGTTVTAIARANGIADPTRLRVGQRLRIPPRTRSLAADSRPETWTRSDPRGSAGRVELIWPVRGRVTSLFGMRDGAHHDGIDVPARPGTPIRAAAAGRVIHADSSLAGYGNMVILKHAGRLSTVYAHNRRNLVRVGEFVEQGDFIGEVGRTGRTTAPHLHFELRRDGRAVDPLDYLP